MGDRETLTAPNIDQEMPGKEKEGKTNLEAKFG